MKGRACEWIRLDRILGGGKHNICNTEFSAEDQGHFSLANVNNAYLPRKNFLSTMAYKRHANSKQDSLKYIDHA